MHLNHPTHIHRPDGLIALPLYYPADYTIDATYTTPRDKTIGAILTILALIILSILLLRDRTRCMTPTTPLIYHQPQCPRT